MLRICPLRTFQNFPYNGYRANVFASAMRVCANANADCIIFSSKKRGAYAPRFSFTALLLSAVIVIIVVITAIVIAVILRRIIAVVRRVIAAILRVITVIRHIVTVRSVIAVVRHIVTVRCIVAVRCAVAVRHIREITRGRAAGAAVAAAEYGAVIAVEDQVGVLDDKIHHVIESEEAEERAEQRPKQHRTAVFVDLDPVARAVFIEAVAELIIPVIGIDSARHEREQDDENIVRRILAVALAGAIDIFRKRVPEDDRVNTARNDR